MVNRAEADAGRLWPKGGGVAVWCGLALAWAVAGGCGFGRVDTSIGPMAQAAQFIPSYDDTIGAYGDVPVNEKTLIRGYGLVLLRSATGSSECPPGIRRIIVDQLNRMRIGETTSVLAGISMERAIESLNTAVVEVRGFMPAGGLANQTFDVLVTALPNTQTTSLEGGVLVSTDLSIWRMGLSRGLISGRVHAVASGPIFINPFAEQVALPGRAEPADSVAPTDPADPAAPTEQAAEPEPDAAVGRPVGTSIDPRRGWVLGGGLLLKDQPLNLTLREPSYHDANRAVEQLQTVFSHGVAHAVSPSLIELKVPQEYRSQPNFWLGLVRQVYLRREPGFLQERMQQLIEEFTWANSTDLERERVALTFIAIGRPALPFLQPLYTHADASVAFYSSWAGLRIGDGLALRMLLTQVMRKDHPSRMKIIQSLGQLHPFRNIASSLAPLLDEDDPEVRVAAYHSMVNLGMPVVNLARLGEPLISREYVGMPPASPRGERLGFDLDLVRCAGPFMIYVTRAENPRIVLFGGEALQLATPAFLNSERTGVTIMGRTGDKTLNVIRIDPLTGRLMVAGETQEPAKDEKGQPLVDELTKQPIFNRVAITDFKCRPMLADLVRTLGGPYVKDMEGRTKGVGLNYGQVVHVLFQLAQANAVPCRVRFQQIPIGQVELASGGPERSDVAPIGSEASTGGPSPGPTDDSAAEPAVIVEPPRGGTPSIGG